jgi:hypothetical protein
VDLALLFHRCRLLYSSLLQNSHNGYVKNIEFTSLDVVAVISAFIYSLILANSPGNVAKWAEIKRKELEDHH